MKIISLRGFILHYYICYLGNCVLSFKNSKNLLLDKLENGDNKSNLQSQQSLYELPPINNLFINFYL